MCVFMEVHIRGSDLQICPKDKYRLNVLGLTIVLNYNHYFSL